MATIWNAPFTISTVSLPLPPVVSTTGTEDEWGIPILSQNNGFMVVELKVKPTKKLTKEIELSLALNEGSILFEGFVISKTPNLSLIAGTKGKGVINGQSGDIRIIATGQSSLGVIRQILGEKVSLEFSKTVGNI